MADTETETVEVDSTEYDWVLTQMLRLGVPHEDAERLTVEGADYRDVKRLLDAGCPMSLTVRIAG